MWECSPWFSEPKTEQIELPTFTYLYLSIFAAHLLRRERSRARDALLLAEPARETETDSDPRYQSRCQHGARDIIHDH